MKNQKKECAKKVLKEKIANFKKNIKIRENSDLFIERSQGFIEGYASALSQMDVITYDDYVNILKEIEESAMSEVLRRADEIIDS